jgi:hypothetical protein
MRRTITSHSPQICVGSPRWVIGSVDALLNGVPVPARSVAMTFDDGTDLDFRDRMHPLHGLQRGMLNILLDFIAVHGRRRQPQLHATAFVIASPEARGELDQRSSCLVRMRRDVR